MFTPSLKHALGAIVALLVLQTTPAWAQMPSQDEFESAVAAVKAEAEGSGLQLRATNLWLLQLKTRAPMLARLSGRICQVGYSAYTPGRNFAWLFPALGPQDRPLWLQGLVHHELAHCVDAKSGSHPSSSTDPTLQRHREAYADLAFALHMDARSQAADRLIATLADLRSQHAGTDPAHDTAAVLRCYLLHPLRAAEPAPSAAEWGARLKSWQQRCGQEPPDSYAAR